MMNYQEFCSYFAEELQGRKYPLKDAEILKLKDGKVEAFTHGKAALEKLLAEDSGFRERMRKDPSEEYLIVMIPLDESHSGILRFPLRQLFLVYQQEGWDSIDRHIMVSLRSAYDGEGQKRIHMLGDYGKIRRYLFIRPMNLTDHREQLRAGIVRTVGDIALAVYLSLSEQEDRSLLSMIHASMAEKWNLTQEEIFREAMENTARQAPPRIYFDPSECVRRDPGVGDFMQQGYRMPDYNIMLGPYITTLGTMNGAAAMFYPGVQERLAELLGGDYYAVFTAVHEARLHRPGELDPEHMLRILEEINAEWPDEMLTRQVYRYDACKKCLSPAAG